MTNKKTRCLQQSLYLRPSSSSLDSSVVVLGRVRLRFLRLFLRLQGPQRLPVCDCVGVNLS